MAKGSEAQKVGLVGRRVPFQAALVWAGMGRQVVCGLPWVRVEFVDEARAAAEMEALGRSVREWGVRLAMMDGRGQGWSHGP